jgi:hypothetical protein
VTRFVVLAVSLLAGLPVGSSVAAQGDAGFVPLADVVGKPLPERVLFFPLDDEVATCLPLTRPCTEHSLPFVLVPATGRRLAWTPEGTRVPEADVTMSPLRALGSPPPRPEVARYLVPVLDGEGATLVFAPRRLEDGRLVPTEAAAVPGTEAVPVLVGPDLAGAPTGPTATRVLAAGSSVQASELTDVTPALLVRRATPHRVVFGVRTGDGYVPLVDDTGVAVLARRGDHVGLAAPSRVATAVASSGAEDREDSGGDGVPVTLVLVAALVVAGALALGLAAGRRRRAGSER